MKKLILASGSPSRKDLLTAAHIPFEVDMSNYEEDMTLQLAPKDLAVFLSKGKAREVAQRHKNRLILAADSFAVFNGELLGKPHTKKRAKQMLTMLSENEHMFVTGFTIIDTDTKHEYSEAVTTKLYLKKLTESEINEYLEEENVLEKAGAYYIQGIGRKLFSKVEGDLDNVKGLPLARIIPKLEEFQAE